MDDAQGRIQSIRAGSLPHFAAMIRRVPYRLEVSPLYSPLAVAMAHSHFSIIIFSGLMQFDLQQFPAALGTEIAAIPSFEEIDKVLVGGADANRNVHDLNGHCVHAEPP